MNNHNYQLLKFPLNKHKQPFCLLPKAYSLKQQAKSSPAQTRTGDPYIISVVL